MKEDEQFKEVYAAMNLREMDIRREAIAEGKIQKSVDDAVVAIRDFNIDPKLAAEKMNAPLDKVMEKLAVQGGLCHHEST